MYLFKGVLGCDCILIGSPRSFLHFLHLILGGSAPVATQEYVTIARFVGVPSTTKSVQMSYFLC